MREHTWDPERVSHAPLSQVLIVDDSPALRAIQWRVLCQSDLPFDGLLEADDGLVGLRRLLENSDVGAVLVDLDLAGAGVLEFVSAVRDQPRWGRLPVVLVSSGRSSAAAALAAGADACLCRPFTAEAARAALEPLLTQNSPGS